MNNKFKKIWILLIVLIILATPVLFANAKGLVPCGGEGEAECSLCHLFVLAQNVTKFLTFTIAPTLAILVVAYGGFNIFLAGASPDKVKTGRNAITKAAVGLLIVFGAWMAINEVLLFLSQQTSSVAEIKTATGKFNPWTDITCSTKTLPASPIKPAPSVTPTSAWGDDSAIRKDLAYYKITVNKQHCKNVGDKDCTSLYGLGDKAIAGLKSLWAYCNYKCDPIIITGGTEYWLHGNKSTDINANNMTWHKPGQNVVDLSNQNSNPLMNQAIEGKYVGTYDKDSQYNNYQVTYVNKADREKLPTGFCSKLGEKGYKFSVPKGKTFCTVLGDCITANEEKILAVYVLENEDVPEHWHVCYY